MVRGFPSPSPAADQSVICYFANSIIEGDNRLEAAAIVELKPRVGAVINVPVRLVGNLRPDGSLGVIEVRGFGPCAQSNMLSVAEFLQECGDWGVDFSRFHSAFPNHWRKRQDFGSVRDELPARFRGFQSIFLRRHPGDAGRGGGLRSLLPVKVAAGGGRGEEGREPEHRERKHWREKGGRYDEGGGT